MIKQILVPVDGSPYAKKAIDFASDLACQYQTGLTLIHVMHRSGSSRVPPELAQYAEVEHVQINEYNMLQAVADQILKTAEAQARKQKVSDLNKVTEIGDPAHKIAEYAKANGTELIVMGSRGLSDLGGLLLGSVSHKVAHLAGCPCLLVR